MLIACICIQFYLICSHVINARKPFAYSSFNCSAGGSTFITEPYYREYFAGGDGSGQGYAPSRSVYGDTAEGPSQSTYEGRYSNHSKSTPVYTKTVTAAGLTVDLPSPDSGIGADAITPRDQNNIQQVNSLCENYRNNHMKPILFFVCHTNTYTRSMTYTHRYKQAYRN